jgi:2-C-methyl-D-erythritol 2,4-cyclodiphosphate synthase
MRVGYGWDSHEFKRGIALKLGGVAVPHDKGLAGHSDGDVLLHALTDALLGAIAAGDIGTYFPPSDPKWKDADSSLFVKEAMRHVRKLGYSVANVDSTLILQEPKIGPHAPAIQLRVAELLGISVADVGVKAKTPEGMGTDNAAIAHVTVLLLRKQGKGQRHAAALDAVPQDIVDSITEGMLEAVGPPAQRPKKK